MIKASSESVSTASSGLKVVVKHKRSLPNNFGIPLEEEAVKNGKRQKTATKKAYEETSNPLKWIIGTELENFSSLSLKPDHVLRPIWLCPNGHIFLETFSPIYRQAYDFLVAVSEPECRSHLFHEYQLTAYSLYAAVSIGLGTEMIIQVLDRLSKIKVPSSVEKFIRESTSSYGKVKLLLQKNRIFLESSVEEILQSLLKDDALAKARIHSEDLQEDSTNGLLVSYIGRPVQISGGISAEPPIDPQLQSEILQEVEEDLSIYSSFTERKKVFSFEVDPSQVESVKKRCSELNFPTLDEYDFRGDTILSNLPIDLKPTTCIRSYQEKCLSKIFGNGRARSGIIVLPCGAGKTLVGITASCTIKKSTLVLCTSGVSVEQWRYQFKLWSNVEDKQIARFTSDQKEYFSTSSGIIITTYTMIGFGGKRSKESLRIMEELCNREWGLVLLDEVHVVPARIFRKVLTVIKGHCKLGLTATLVREDEKIGDLNFLIGPKLYEANWLDLQRAGHIANVQCAEVWCPMAPEFYREYLDTESNGRKTLLYVMNPIKFQYCQFLIKHHEQRGDKIIVFSDNIFALKMYATKLKKPLIYGATGGEERMAVLNTFRRNPEMNSIFISKVGDTSIDLPEANVIIQISSHYGSRRQEAQRLGRILRPKANSENEFNAFFYSLVSKDTHEMYYSTKRQQFLIDQGYSFKVIASLPIDQEQDSLYYQTKQEQMELLTTVLNADEKEGHEEQLPDDFDYSKLQTCAGNTASFRRAIANTQELSGADGLVYIEKKSSGVRPKERR